MTGQQFGMLQAALGCSNQQMAVALGVCVRSITRYAGAARVPDYAALAMLTLCRMRDIATPDTWDNRDWYALEHPTHFIRRGRGRPRTRPLPDKKLRKKT